MFSSNGKPGNPVVFTEKNPDNSLSLFFNPLKEDQTGLYTCIGTYAQTEIFNKSVNVQTIGKNIYLFHKFIQIKIKLILENLLSEA